MKIIKHTEISVGDELVMSAGFVPPLAEGWLLVHWAYGGVQRQKHRLDVDDEIFIDWTWVWPMKTLNLWL